MVFGRLTLIRRTEHKFKWWYYWECVCTCGKTVEIISRSIVYKNTKSCGCLQKEAARKNGRRHANGIAAAHRLFGQRRWLAFKNKIEFKLTEKEFLKLTTQNCFYCGRPPQNQTSLPEVNGQYVYNGIDRTDNEKGYTLCNTVPCCKQCNFAKRDIPQAAFVAWLREAGTWQLKQARADFSASAFSYHFQAPHRKSHRSCPNRP